MKNEDATGASRRVVLAGVIAGLVPAVSAAQTNAGRQETMAKGWHAYVGARTTRERNARGDGLNVYRVSADGTWRHEQLVDDLVNPSFLTFDRSGKFLYTVHGDESYVTAFRVDGATGRLERLNQESTGGKNPVHLSVDPTNRFLVVANHITSTLAVLPVREDGSLGKLLGLTPVTGKIGPHRVEQPFPKPHQVLFDPAGRFIAVPDKGVDRTFTYRLNGEGALALQNPGSFSREGAGPRHITFHPKATHAYIVNELGSTITACRYDAATGVLTPIQTIPSVPDTFCEDSRAAEIEISPNGRFVYVSNRGSDSIGVFAVSQASGRLTPVYWQPTFGKTPRFLTIDPSNRYLFAANEESDSIITFAIDTASGRLSQVGKAVTVGSPVCILLKPIA